MAASEQKYSDRIKEIPLQENLPPYLIGALMEQPFFGFEGLSVRYGLCGKEGMLVEETNRQHVHDYDQLLFFLSDDPYDMLNLGAEIEISIGQKNERYRINQPTAVAIPKGHPHFSPVVRSFTRKFYFIAVSRASKCEATVVDPTLAQDAGELGRFFGEYHGNFINLRFMKKGLYFYGADSVEHSGGTFTSCTGAMSGLDLLMTWQTIELPHTMGPREKDGSHLPHSHNFNEVLFFFGGDPEHLTELGGCCEFCLGEEMEPHLITKASAVIAPKGFVHTPQRFLRVDYPYYFSALSCAGEHHKTQRQ